MVKGLRRVKSLPAVTEAQLVTELASVQVIRLDWRENTELVIEPLDHFQMDLCLSARLQGMSVCFPGHWGSLRFERVGELMLIPPGEKVTARCEFPDGVDHYTHASTVVRLDPALVYEWSGTDVSWSAERLRLIDERAQQIGRAPTIAELAALCRISSRQLQRGFRVSRGCSIGRHIEYCRIENAKRLLQRGEAIDTVATTLGYASQSSFSYAFRRATGGTPAQFRRLV